MRINQPPLPSYWEVAAKPEPYDVRSHGSGSVAADSARPDWSYPGVYARRSTPFEMKLREQYLAASGYLPYSPMTQIHVINLRPNQTVILPCGVSISYMCSSPFSQLHPSSHASRIQYEINRFLGGLRSRPSTHGTSTLTDQQPDWKARGLSMLKPMCKLVSGAFKAFGEGGSGESFSV